MVGTRSSRSKPQLFPTDENVPAELAAPKRGGKGKRKSKAAKAAAAPEVVTEDEEVNKEVGNGAGDKMELDNEQVDHTVMGETAKASDEAGVDKTMKKTFVSDEPMYSTMPEVMGQVDRVLKETDDFLSRQVPKVSTMADYMATVQKTKSPELTERGASPHVASDETMASGVSASDSPAAMSEIEIRRSGRKRLAPAALEEVAEKAVKTKAGAKASPWKKLGKGNAADNNSEWEEEYLMTNPGSVYATNLGDFFNADVWIQFSETERAYLMTFLPECDKVYSPSANLSDPATPKPELADGFWDNPQLLARISHVEADIADGKYTAENQAAIVEARKRSEAGEFNTFKDNKFEQFWGQKQRVNYEAMAGDTSSVKIQTLAKHQALRVGDVFSLRRSFGRGGVTIEKDAKLTAIDPADFSLTFSYPPGRLQVSSDQKPDKIISKVISITALESLLCKEDGRGPARLPNGNAFKTFRVKRNEQDIGSLFDVRMEFHAKYLNPKAD